MSLSITANTLSPWLPCPPAQGPSLQGAIATATTYAEGPLGANRPLGPYRYDDEIWSATNTFRLSYWPIIAEPAPVFKIRSQGLGRDGFGRLIGNGSTIELTDDDYELNLRTGELIVRSVQAVGVGHSYGGSPYSNSAARDPLAPTPSSQLIAEYTAGFADGAPELQAIYGAIASLVSYLSGPTASGVAEIQTQREGRVRYSNAAGAYSGLYGAGAGQIPEALLMPFHKFRPKSQGII